MRHPNICSNVRILFKIHIIKTPVMWEVGSNQNYISSFETLDTVANKLSAFTLVEMDQLNLWMIMPSIVNVRNQVMSYTKRVAGFFGNLKELRSHTAFFSL